MSRTCAILCLVCLLFTALWVGLLIVDMASAGPLDTFDQVAAPGWALIGSVPWCLLIARDLFRLSKRGDKT